MHILNLNEYFKYVIIHTRHNGKYCEITCENTEIRNALNDLTKHGYIPFAYQKSPKHRSIILDKKIFDEELEIGERMIEPYLYAR